MPEAQKINDCFAKKFQPQQLNKKVCFLGFHQKVQFDGSTLQHSYTTAAHSWSVTTRSETHFDTIIENFNNITEKVGAE